jgi:hypothetical protein
MSDLDLWQDEKFIRNDDLLLRIVRHLDADVRRDMVGWLKAPHAEHTATRFDIRALLVDYVRGAAQVVDLFPEAEPLSSVSDRAALARDSELIGDDIRGVTLLARALLEQRKQAAGKAIR